MRRARELFMIVPLWMYQGSSGWSLLISLSLRAVRAEATQGAVFAHLAVNAGPRSWTPATKS